MVIDLPNFICDRVKTIAVGDGLQSQLWRPPTHAFVVSIGDWHINARTAIRCRAEDDSFFAHAEAPGIVVRRANELDRRAIGPETMKALGEADFFIAYSDRRLVVSLHAPDPIVEAI